MPGRPRCRSMGRLNVASLASRRPFVISWRAAIGLAPPAPLEPPLDLARRQRRDRAPCRSPSKFALMELMKPGTYSPSVSTAPISKSRFVMIPDVTKGCGMTGTPFTLRLLNVINSPFKVRKISRKFGSPLRLPRRTCFSSFSCWCRVTKRQTASRRFSAVLSIASESHCFGMSATNGSRAFQNGLPKPRFEGSPSSNRMLQ